MERKSSILTLAEIEREHVLKTLAHCSGNRTHTAKLLGISIRWLRIKLHEYRRAGFDVPTPNHKIDSVAGGRRLGYQARHHPNVGAIRNLPLKVIASLGFPTTIFIHSVLLL